MQKDTSLLAVGSFIVGRTTKK